MIRINNVKRLSSIKTFGHSMYPLLHNEDIVYLSKVKFNKLKTDDIICFKKYGRLQTHRIIYLTNKYVIAKGDNNLSSDGKIYPRQIIGKVYQVKRNKKVFTPEELYLYQSTIYLQEINKIKDTFEKAGLDYVFLKGLPLYLHYLKKHPRRLYADCDILVKRKDEEHIIAIFSQAGYHLVEKSLSPLHKYLQKEKAQISLYKVINNFHIEFDIHFEAIFTVNQLGNLHFLYPKKLSNTIKNNFIKEKRYIHLHGNKYPILSPINNMLFQCHHLSRHSFKGAYRLDFINTLLQKDFTDNKTSDELIDKAKKYKLRNFVGTSMILLSKHYNSYRAKNISNKISSEIPLGLNRIINSYRSTDIFEDEGRIHGGINRFKVQYKLSERQKIIKSLVFFQPSVFYSLLWITYNWTKIKLRKLPLDMGR